MKHVSIIGLGNLSPNLIVPDALERLSRAALIIVDASLSADSLSPLFDKLENRPTIRSFQTEGNARLFFLKCAQDGTRVARVRKGQGFSCPEALRDARILRDAQIPFDIIPGIEESCADWLDWFDSHPLAGRQILVPRMKGQSADTAERLSFLGAAPLLFPTIELHPPPNPERLDQAAIALSTYDLVAFTSKNGVDCFFDSLYRQNKDARAFGNCLVAAIGSATAQSLNVKGVIPDIVAKDFRGESLADSILSKLGNPAGKRALIPRALDAREVLPEMLRNANMHVDIVPAYETRAPSANSIAPLVEALKNGQVDAILLSSSSTVQNLCVLLGSDYQQLLSRTLLASIGPITSQTIRDKQLRVGVEANEYTLPCLIQSLADHFQTL